MILLPENERKLIVDILTKYGVSEEDAKITADVFVDADLKGFTSHGIGRFPQYVEGLECGNINPNPNIKVVKETPATATIDGDFGLGQVVGKKAMELAIEKAKNVGIGAVATRNSNHFGIAGYYSEMAMREGLIGITITNTEPAMAPFGGKDKILGTNPVAIAFKGKKYVFSLDMATASIARGKILEMARLGKSIPEGCAVDKDGNLTTDPIKALEGSILPFGGPKGYGLALAIEALAAIGGAEMGTKVKGTANPKDKCTKGDLFMAIDPGAFWDREKFMEKVDELMDEIKNSEPAKGFSEVLIPGDIERMNMEKRKNGFEIDEVLYKRLKEICEKNGLDINDYVKVE
ncbi:L-sulfolactate dehydrogenase [Methanotorris igneus]|uniref:(R)-2-hydroxyacid dehydrogenase n=1 Tax=Methanotorris igneus (strain DSM 5666 / JCM 11834 / Kol 5) TaxID=880724 RepID=F6BCQ5_METIK|nr:L-sulfolactate dehydrogenase [Methanotorris igneus]AEF96266.1 (R)-2-hydroxyacid dehydrogenase [Methanotorris igneus Kol 5]